MKWKSSFDEWTIINLGNDKHAHHMTSYSAYTWSMLSSYSVCWLVQYNSCHVQLIPCHASVHLVLFPDYSFRTQRKNSLETRLVHTKAFLLRKFNNINSWCVVIFCPSWLNWHGIIPKCSLLEISTCITFHCIIIACTPSCMHIISLLVSVTVNKSVE